MHARVLLLLLTLSAMVSERHRGGLNDSGTALLLQVRYSGAKRVQTSATPAPMCRMIPPRRAKDGQSVGRVRERAENEK